MKVFIFAQPRTRSTYLQDIISRHYKLSNLHEPTVELDKKFEGKAKFYNPNKSWTLYQDHLEKYFQDTIDNSCTKVLSNVLINNNFYYRKHFKEDYILSPDDIIDPVKTLQLDKFDKVYVLRRKSIIDIICSYHYAYQIGKRYSFSKNQNVKMFDPKGKKLYVSTKKTICNDLLHLLTFEHIPDFIKNKGISVIDLFYEDIPSYIKSNFTGTETVYQEQNFDYSKFANYETLSNLIEESVYELKSKNNFKTLLSK